MTPTIAHGLLLFAAIYLAAGWIVGVPFLIFGIGRIDPAAKAAPWTFRLLVTPGVVALWPFLLRRWLGSRGTR